MQYRKGDIVKLSSKEKSTIGLINQVDDGILLVGSQWISVEDFEIKILHREV